MIIMFMLNMEIFLEHEWSVGISFFSLGKRETLEVMLLFNNKTANAFLSSFMSSQRTICSFVMFKTTLSVLV